VRLLVEQVRGLRGGTEPQATHKMLKFTLVKRDSTAALGAAPGDSKSEKRSTRRKGPSTS
jgi:hypothetical protein